MSTPTSSSGEEEKNSRTEYNALLAKSHSRSSSTGNSNFGTSPGADVDFWEDKHPLLPSTESLDFEEVESVIWRKVHIINQ